MDKKGRILIRSGERMRLGLKAGNEFEIVRTEGVIVLKPIIPEPVQVDTMRRSFGKDAFLDAGEATFGGQ